MFVLLLLTGFAFCFDCLCLFAVDDVMLIVRFDCGVSCFILIDLFCLVCLVLLVVCLFMVCLFCCLLD